MTSTLSGLVAFLETGALPPGLFAPDAVSDFTVLSWRFALHGPAAMAAQRRHARWAPRPGRTGPKPRVRTVREFMTIGHIAVAHSTPLTRARQSP